MNKKKGKQKFIARLIFQFSYTQKKTCPYGSMEGNDNTKDSDNSDNSNISDNDKDNTRHNDNNRNINVINNNE